MAQNRTHVTRDNCLFRWLDWPAGDLEIYRGDGRWERWLETEDWLDGLLLSDEDAKKFMQQWDEGAVGRV